MKKIKLVTWLTLVSTLLQPLAMASTNRVTTHGEVVLSQIATPANPASGANKVYTKSDGRLYTLNSSGTETPVGSGMGNINFLGINSSLLQGDSNNINADSSLGTWVTYNDSSAIPTTMLGGSATSLTLSRTTTSGEVLNGAGSFKLVKTATNAQGQGVSALGYVPDAYRGQPCLIYIPYKILSGSIVQGDVKAYLIDNATGTVITPFNNDMVGSNSGVLVAPFTSTSSAHLIRVGLHFASTSATALTISFDDVSVGPSSAAFGMAGSNAIQRSSDFTVNSFGATTENDFTVTRVGNRAIIDGHFLMGTAAATTASISLPNDLKIDVTAANSVGTSGRKVGDVWFTPNAGPSSIASNNFLGVGFYDGSDNTKIFITNAVGSNTFTKVNGTSFSNNNSRVYFHFDYPVIGWDANVTMAQSSTFNISSFLANGTRVTGTAPTQLGQYRSYLRQGGGRTYSETNGSPSTAPSDANGIAIWGGPTYASTDTSNQPSRYDIFIGKNKNWKIQAYSSTARSGGLDTQVVYWAGTYDIGLQGVYDRTTGVLSVFNPRITGTVGVTGAIGIDPTGSSPATSGYFDIIVSENALAVGVQAPRSEVWLSAGNGAGSTNTTVRRYTNVRKNVGTALLLTQSSTLGDSVTVLEDGVYSITQIDVDCIMETTVNSTTLNGSPPNTSVVTYLATKVGDGGTATVTLNLKAGDVVRAQYVAGNVGASTADNASQFRVTKVSN